MTSGDNDNARTMASSKTTCKPSNDELWKKNSIEQNAVVGLIQEGVDFGLVVGLGCALLFEFLNTILLAALIVVRIVGIAVLGIEEELENWVVYKAYKRATWAKKKKGKTRAKTATPTLPESRANSYVAARLRNKGKPQSGHGKSKTASAEKRTKSGLRWRPASPFDMRSSVRPGKRPRQESFRRDALIRRGQFKNRRKSRSRRR